MAQLYESEKEKRKTIIAEGKTKIIERIPREPRKVRVINKNELTKGDGKDRISWEGKGAFSNKTACNCFRYLEYYFRRNNMTVPTHFFEEYDDYSFIAHRVTMYPIETVYRRVATGSALKRYPGLKEGDLFEVIEFFYKDDAAGDPYMVFNEETEWYDLYDSKKPVSPETYLGEVPRTAFMPSKEQLDTIALYQGQIFEALSKAWADEGTVLVDLKCEYGESLDGIIMLSDDVNADCCRLWPFGDKNQMKDKEVFRQMVGEITPAQKAILNKNYLWVVETTSRFPGNNVTT
ncbi:MAG: phosphoribosylaminoimidazolesuccinocarboxamide synthase [Candidatus Pacebacteria bacterium]|jgi:phosphoribosylaminoimidazole-succinocarboxamide synthase|nr:phosphoribosylaminoimidazolesuccinocarboxamide synthase [Candidatus Paceibacterota bacterium]